MSDNFTVWFAEHKSDVPKRASVREFAEAAEAADVAENYLQRYGAGGESYCEIRFNGDSEPHTLIFLMDNDEPPTFGVFNTPSSMWPLYYADSPYGIMLDGNPLDEIEAEGGGKHKKDDDSDKMDLGGQDDGDEEEDWDNEDEADTESEGDSEEFPDQDDSENEDDEEEDFTDGDKDADSDENEESDDDSEDENKTESEADEDEDGESEDEKEMPRLNIFAKMRGPKGWRKRAEAEELQERNVFGLKVGILDSEAEKPGQQERNVVAHVEFIESDTTRDHGILKLRLPDGVTLEDFTQTKTGVISVKVPYNG